MRRTFTKFLRFLFSITAAITLTAFTIACADTGDQNNNADKLVIYATTGYLADVAKNLAPEAEVFTMVGPGGDPHTYQASTKDIEKLRSADLVLWNGLHLEAQMIDILRSRGEAQLEVGALLDPAQLIELPESDATAEMLYDPHIWNSAELWIIVVEQVAEKLATLDRVNSENYQSRAKEFISKIEAADGEARALLETLPTEVQKVLITGHDAFNYFGKSYGFEVYATDFISTEAALSATEISNLAKLIADKKVSVIFQDNQANPQAITGLKEAVAALGWQVEIHNAVLYADTLGAESGVDTYLGVLQHNTETIYTALNR